MLAAKLDRCMAHVHAAPPALRTGAAAQLRRREPDRGDASLSGRTDAKRRREHGLAADEVQMVKRGRVCANEPPKVGNDIGGRAGAGHDRCFFRRGRSRRKLLPDGFGNVAVFHQGRDEICRRHGAGSRNALSGPERDKVGNALLSSGITHRPREVVLLP